MHVIFLAPHFPANQRRFVAGLKAVGARVSGIGDARPEHLPSDVAAMLDAYVHVSNVTDPDAVTDAVARIQAAGPWVHRLEATVEAHMMCAAQAREARGIPGLSAQTVELCRDKYKMKAFLGSRGFPVAQQAEVNRGDDLRAFVQAVGFPLILKPRAGAGAAATYKLDDAAQVEAAIAQTGLDAGPRPFTAEQFLDGHEGFFDTLTVNGQVAFEAISHYYPNVLPAMRDRDCSPMIVTTNRLDAPGYQELRRFGREVVTAMDIGTSPTHMEWFFGPQGLKFSEIGARPPGVNVWDLYREVLGVDLYQEWARAICYGDTRGLSGPRLAGGLVAIRPNQDGTIRGFSGLDEAQERFGEFIWRANLPSPGTPTQPVEAGYLANAAVWVKHPDFDEAKRILGEIGELVSVWAD